jgi:hypothetical protein
MADTKVSALTELAAGPAETDEVYINDGGTSKRITAVELLNPENFTAVVLPAAADELFINDDGTGKKITHDDLLFGANGTPSTQAHGDSAAIGTALDAARSNHKHAMPAAGGGAVTREGGQATEATTTSTTDTDLLTAASLTIATGGTPTEVWANCRRTTGASTQVYIGFKINGNLVMPATSGAGAHFLGSQNSNFVALFVWLMTSFVTGYDGNTPGIQCHTFDSAGTPQRWTRFNSSSMPDATITDLLIRAATDSASVTVGADSMNVFSKDIA